VTGPVVMFVVGVVFVNLPWALRSHGVGQTAVLCVAIALIGAGVLVGFACGKLENRRSASKRWRG
jgi:hypothetical protein